MAVTGGSASSTFVWLDYLNTNPSVPPSPLRLLSFLPPFLLSTSPQPRLLVILDSLTSPTVLKNSLAVFQLFLSLSVGITVDIVHHTSDSGQSEGVGGKTVDIGVDLPDPTVSRPFSVSWLLNNLSLLLELSKVS